MSKKFIHIFSVSVLLFLVSFNIVSNAQTEPTNPNTGGIDLPLVIDPGDSSNTNQNPNSNQNPNPNSNSNINVESPNTPTISSEEILEDTGETLPVETDDSGFNLNPGPDEPVIPNPEVNTNTSTVNNVSTDSTVRSGGLEVGLAILFAAVMGGLYYYYRKNNNTKSALKTKEKKLKY